MPVTASEGMRSILEQLESDQAIILMYVADELAPADRAQVEQRLAIDAAFRQQLEDLQKIHSEIDAGFASLDAAQPLPASVLSAQAKVSRLMKQWNTDRLTRRRSAVETPGVFSRLAPAYPFIAAAALFCGFIIWWGLRDDGQLPPIATTQNLIDAMPSADPAVPVGVAAVPVVHKTPVDTFFEIVASAPEPASNVLPEIDADDDLNSAESAIQFVVSLRTMNDIEEWVEQ